MSPWSNQLRLMSRWRGLLPRIDALGPPLESLDSYTLRKQSLALRHRAKSGETLDALLPEAYALVREAGRRVLSMRHYDVQLLGGIAMHHRSIAVMQTGEGKTLTATLPLYLSALLGQGAHLATVNDYLARRDAEWMEPIYNALGMTVGIIESQMPQQERRGAYACDVTYGTAKEFGFDFLRDRLLGRRITEGATDIVGRMIGNANDSNEQPVQRPPYFALVDEADSILIDEARTPLIISALPGDSEQVAIATYQWTAAVAGCFLEDEHYDYDHEKQKVELNTNGRRLVREIPQPELLNAVSMIDLYDQIELGIKVNRDFQRDRHYVVRDDEVVIVDEFTGRLAEGRKWRSGIHQLIEAREDVEVTVDTGQAARITVQDYFSRYERLAGMTGTVANSGPELRKIYELKVVEIPTNRPAVRQQLPTRIFATAVEKWQAILQEVIEVHASGRPILIGTRSIDKSELLAKLLAEHGIEHQVLNARFVEQEAEIVAGAGQCNKVTVSTNMAGRGTDVKLGPGVQELGGMHVICTELHESARIDRQLIGRCGRQGDPGTFRQYLALDDDILRVGFKPKRTKQLAKARVEKSLDATFRKAQANVERKHFRDRKTLLYHERERKKVQRQMGQDPYLDTPG